MVEAKQALEVQLIQALDNNKCITDSMQILKLEKEGLSQKVEDLEKQN
jgi:hypothetical protein